MEDSTPTQVQYIFTLITLPATIMHVYDPCNMMWGQILDLFVIKWKRQTINFFIWLVITILCFMFCYTYTNSLYCSYSTNV